MKRVDMGGCRGVVRRVEARGRTRQTQIGSQGGSSVMIPLLVTRMTILTTYFYLKQEVVLPNNTKQNKPNKG